jgi:hypothetical protein
LLYSQPPDIQRRGANLELRFTVPENSARLLLGRIAKTDAAAALTAQ